MSGLPAYSPGRRELRLPHVGIHGSRLLLPHCLQHAGSCERRGRIQPIDPLLRQTPGRTLYDASESMHLDFTGLNAFITGGANGIGFACARRLTQSGARVTIFDAEENEAADQVHARTMIGDVRDGACLVNAMKLCAGAGRLDVVVINAGTAVPSPILATTDEIWQR